MAEKFTARTGGVMLPNVAGQQFAQLLALWPVIRNQYRDMLWVCQCTCGTIRIVGLSRLRTEQVNSCSLCARARFIAERTRHGHSRRTSGKSSEYYAYHNARRRCNSKETRSFDDYGARGIKFRFTTFEEFYAELGPKPSPEHSLDRINNDGHYEPGNVRWATAKEQLNNRRLKRIDQFSLKELQAELQRRIAS